MEKSMIKWFTESDFQAMVEAVIADAPAHIYQALFPENSTPFLTWESILNGGKYAAAAPVISFDSSAPIASRENFDKLSGEINPIARKRKLSEKLIIELNNPRVKSNIISQIYDDIAYVIEAIRYRLDYMALQTISSGAIVLDGTTNADGITATLDWQVDSDYKKVVSTIWSTSASCTPIADIQGWVKTLNDAGINPTVMWMKRKTLNYLKNSDEFISDYTTIGVNNRSRSALMGLDQVNEVLDNADLPMIALVDDRIKYQEAEGTFDVTKQAWKDNVVAFTEGVAQGETLFAPLAEELVDQSGAMFQKAGMGYGIQKYSEKDPVGEWTKGKAIAFPVWAKSNRVLLANTESTTTF